MAVFLILKYHTTTEKSPTLQPQLNQPCLNLTDTDSKLPSHSAHHNQDFSKTLQPL